MYSVNKVSDCFKNFIKQTSTSTFKIYFDEGDFIDYHISLNYNIEDSFIINKENSPIIKIDNLSEFINNLTILLNKMASFHISDKEKFDFNDDNFLKYLLMSCITNMNEMDFNYPDKYLDFLYLFTIL